MELPDIHAEAGGMKKSLELGARYISVAQLRRRWGISAAHAYRVAERLGCLRIGAAIRVPLAAVENFEKAQLGSVPPEVP